MDVQRAPAERLYIALRDVESLSSTDAAAVAGVSIRGLRSLLDYMTWHYAIWEDKMCGHIRVGLIR